jgi:cytochrome c oxidase subunit 2
MMGALLAIGLALLSTANAPERVVKVTAERFRFEPAVIELKLGEPVILEISTLDRKHGFAVPELAIDAAIEPGRVTRVAITPTKAGTFPLHCSVFCGTNHEDMGGTIVVKP